MKKNYFQLGFLTFVMLIMGATACTDYYILDNPEDITEFTDGTDGWKIEGDASEVDPEYSSTDGVNGSGYIFAKDNVTGGVWYFIAPSKYHGDRSEFYGGYLRFYLIQESAMASQFEKEDIIIDGGTLGKLVYYFSSYPASTWTKYQVDLNDAAGWYDETGVEASMTKIKSVLSNITKLSIRGEFESGSDTGGLDSFSFVK